MATDHTRDAIIIRRAGERDLDHLEALENALFVHDRLSRRALRYYLTRSTAILLVAEQEHFLLAYALVALRTNSKIARLYSIAVSSAASGRGLGRRLLMACEASASAAGAQWMRLEVRLDNQAAIHLYRVMGYRQFDEIENYYEDETGALRFEKALSAAAAHAARPRSPRW